MKPNPCGTPQGGVISPLLANRYLKALDWAVNERVAGQPVMVRSADDFVIPSGPGQGTALKTRRQNWLEKRGLKLHEAKTRLVDRREGFNFLAFTVGWQAPQRTGRPYAQVEPSAKSRRRARPWEAPPQPLGPVESHPNSHWRTESTPEWLEWILPLPPQQPSHGIDAGMDPGATQALVVAQT